MKMLKNFLILLAMGALWMPLQAGARPEQQETNAQSTLKVDLSDMVPLSKQQILDAKIPLELREKWEEILVERNRGRSNEGLCPTVMVTCENNPYIFTWLDQVKPGWFDSFTNSLQKTLTVAEGCAALGLGGGGVCGAISTISDYYASRKECLPATDGGYPLQNAAAMCALNNDQLKIIDWNPQSEDAFVAGPIKCVGNGDPGRLEDYFCPKREMQKITHKLINLAVKMDASQDDEDAAPEPQEPKRDARSKRPARADVSEEDSQPEAQASRHTRFTRRVRA